MKTLKKMIIGLAFWVGLIAMACWGGYMESVYDQLAICTGWDGEVYEFMDNSGNLWEWEPDSYLEYYEVGKAYRLVMYDEKTSSIYDDSILKIKKR